MERYINFVKPKMHIGDSSCNPEYGNDGVGGVAKPERTSHLFSVLLHFLCVLSII